MNDPAYNGLAIWPIPLLYLSLKLALILGVMRGF
jgi:hypothetical protein